MNQNTQRTITKTFKDTYLFHNLGIVLNRRTAAKFATSGADCESKERKQNHATADDAVSVSEHSQQSLRSCQMGRISVTHKRLTNCKRWRSMPRVHLLDFQRFFWISFLTKAYLGPAMVMKQWDCFSSRRMFPLRLNDDAPAGARTRDLLITDPAL